MHNNTRSLLLGLSSVLLWSTVATAFKLTLRFTTPYGMLFFASVLSALFFLMVIVVKGKKVVWRKEVFLLGLLNPMLYYMFLFEAYDRLLAQVALCINYLWPVVLVIISVIFRNEKITKRGILGIILGFLGVVIVGTRGNLKTLIGGDLKGIIFALLSTVVWAFYWDRNRFIKEDAEVKLFQGFVFALPFILLVSLFSGGIIVNKNALLGSLYVGLFEMGVTFFLWLSALELARNVQHLAALIYLSPPISLVIIHLVLHEPVYSSTVVGFVFVLIGVYLSKKEIPVSA